MRSDRWPVTALLLTGPAALLGGALAFQHVGGLAPCEMCLWQRWALVAALALALLGWVLRHARAVLALSALAVLAGAAIAVFHVGVEQHWWPGITACAAAPVTGSAADVMGQIMAQPLVRCDAIAWSLFGISMAGWNALISIAIGGTALWRLKRA
ncbi:disulfide bond formation protein B [Polymorphobacter fuscus]|uniref:Disulfide bond formation protein B n=1 Tax=Sandarakinorhabdus fusca TaxID=1439888 RepID=A0A7C9KNL7_9SPHN|nr:disulfide bond formation protein B [Polymorphobacter fuscus]KAB7646570.1 disulfide bond formation protein B [Polymorphobacter fuscus]MQT17824.1 disulfide bond formation protein B [Polymorphobacter fuscus]NJC09627.1 disulfide bond formation protein DsbB [Polymorphobacter fuscus]